MPSGRLCFDGNQKIQRKQSANTSKPPSHVWVEFVEEIEKKIERTVRREVENRRRGAHFLAAKRDTMLRWPTVLGAKQLREERGARNRQISNHGAYCLTATFECAAFACQLGACLAADRKRSEKIFSSLHKCVLKACCVFLFLPQCIRNRGIKRGEFSMQSNIFVEPIVVDNERSSISTANRLGPDCAAAVAERNKWRKEKKKI